tara:strand:+ start:261 stop:1061 length:801 start_codon:yes stop_codon:yes gene_type:complete
MRKFLFVLSLAFVSGLYFSSSASSEENFTISVDPGWMDEKETNCRTITEDRVNGTYEYEKCDYYLEYEINLTDDADWSIGDDGTTASWIRRDMPHTPNSLNSTFVFSLHGTNFSKNIEYKFSYVVYSFLDYEELKIEAGKSQITLAESQVTFFGNGSIETNLSGTFNGGIAIDSDYIPEDEKTLILKDECSEVFVHVNLEGTNVSTGNLSLSKTYSSGWFFLNDSTKLKCKYYSSMDGDAGFHIPSLHFVVVLMVISFVSFRKTKD